MYSINIVTNQDVLFGKPYIKWTRISVEQILYCLIQWWNADKILEEFPDLTKENIIDALEYSREIIWRIHLY